MNLKRLILSFTVICLVSIIFTYLELQNSSINTPKTSPLAPNAKYGHEMVYDQSQQRIILFGGRSSEGVSEDESWIFNYTSGYWYELSPSNSPSARMAHSMVYDILNNQIILFGGIGTEVSSETWLFDCSTDEWAQVYPNLSPPARFSADMAYNSFNHQVIMFGGLDMNGYGLSDTWIFYPENNSWVQIFPISPPASRYGHKMVYDSENNIVILFEGNGMGSGHEEDTWVFFSINNTWKNLNPLHKPTQRYWHSVVYDSTLEQIVLFGGSSLNIDKNDIWVYSYSNNSWNLNYVSNSPSPRHFAALVYDSTHCKVILYGGNNEAHYPMNDTWMYDFILNHWEKFGNS